MPAFLALKFLGLPRWAWLAFAIVLAVGAGVMIVGGAIEDVLDTAETKGALEARNAGQDTTLGQIGAANEAGDKVRNRIGDAKFCECVRSSTAGTASNCIRYWTDESVPDGPDNPGAYCARRTR